MITKIQTLTPGDQFLTRRDLATRWLCSEMTIKRREAQGLLKPIRHGRIVRYRLADIATLETKLG